MLSTSLRRSGATSVRTACVVFGGSFFRTIFEILKTLNHQRSPPRIKELRAALAKQFGFETVESEDVEELLASHCEDLAMADL
jgi:hypothetical protein